MSNKTKINSLLDVPSIVAYLDRIGAKPRSIKTAVVQEASGRYWRDLAVIRFDPANDKVKVSGDEGDASASYGPTKEELSAIVDEMPLYEWPEVLLANSWASYGEPEEFRAAREQRRLLEFRDTDGNLAMVQVRHRHKVPEHGEPKYLSFTLWTDGTIRMTEPDRLPLWGIDKAQGHSVAFLHEGAMAARAMAEMASGRTQKDRDRLANHPWGEELRYAAHLGWVGGAQSPHRTDWSILKRMGIKVIYVVADNDADGRSAVRKISKRLDLPTFSVEFTDKWPASFDLADEFPASMFREREDGARYYIGPVFMDVVHPATWATDLKPVPNSSVKKYGEARQHFADQWAYVHEVDQYVNLVRPSIRKQRAQFNALVRPFSDVTDTADLLLKAYQRGTIAKLAYRPDQYQPSQPSARITVDGESAINVFTPTRVKPVAGDPTPWLEFLAYLFPNAQDQKEVERWCATLIARLDIRMEYGLLLMSKMQGTGKNTLGTKILAPLVGWHNTSVPNATAITDSQFNGWLANKRLVFVAEIYEGQNWKAYHKIKSYISDKEVDVNEKHQRPYKTDNWSHMVACSNDELALKVEENDRRWLVPLVAENPWPREKFAALYDWLAGEGLSIIMHWALTYGDYVAEGERAPMTSRKQQAIADSRSDEERWVEELCSAIVEEETALVFSSKEAFDIIKSRTRGPLYVKAHDLGKAMIRAGWIRYDDPSPKSDGKITIRGGRHIVFLSPKAKEELDGIVDLKEKRDRLGGLEKVGADRMKEQFNPM